MISANTSGMLNVNSSVTLTCVVTFQSHVDVQFISLTWGGPGDVSGKPYSVMEIDDGLRYTSTLTLSRVGKSDEGEYTCRVSVYEGADAISDSFHVSVLGKGN